MEYLYYTSSVYPNLGSCWNRIYTPKKLPAKLCRIFPDFLNGWFRCISYWNDRPGRWFPWGFCCNGRVRASWRCRWRLNDNLLKWCLGRCQCGYLENRKIGPRLVGKGKAFHKFCFSTFHFFWLVKWLNQKSARSLLLTSCVSFFEGWNDWKHGGLKRILEGGPCDIRMASERGSFRGLAGGLSTCPRRLGVSPNR